MRVLRAAAFLIAIAGAIDPVAAVRRPASLPVDVILPPASDPGFEHARRIRDRLFEALGDSIRAGSGEAPRAVLAVGNVALPDVPAAPVFAVPAPDIAGVQAIAAPAVATLWGQQPLVSASYRGRRMKGQATTFRLVTPAGATLGTVPHTWTADDETFVPSFRFVPRSPGVVPLRIVADSRGVASASADVAVSVADRRARVLVFEPRPSWAASFARQALEADPLFVTSGLARTSRGVLTRTAAAPSSLSALDPDAIDVLIVGGLEALTAGDLEAVEAFAARRGGTAILVPDARIPDGVRRALDLPSTTDVLLARPVDVRQGPLVIRASEVLRLADRDKTENDALLTVVRGKGQVLVVTALDAWRHRGDPQSAFGRFWQSVAAEAALASARPVTVRVDPVIVRPADPVTLTLAFRSPGGAGLPRAAASIVGASETAEVVRLWPGTAANEYVGRFVSPGPGRYDVRVDVEGHPRQDAVLLVDATAAGVASDRSRQLAFAAAATGGALFADGDLGRLADAIRALPAPSESRPVRPARSAWWVLAFVAVLGSEWAVRRRRGLR
jgi:hypothetical protein